MLNKRYRAEKVLHRDAIAVADAVKSSASVNSGPLIMAIFLDITARSQCL